MNRTALELGQEKPIERYDLIESDKVEGTSVYRSNGEKIGQIERVMIGKRNGQVAYAVMSFGGFLGLGHEHYPIPWEKLSYNDALGGYEVDVSDQELKNAPKFDPGEEWNWSDPEQSRRISRYYRMPLGI